MFSAGAVAQAIEVSTPSNVSNRTFHSGDIVNLTTVIKNDFSRTKNFTVEEYILYPDIEPVLLLDVIELEPNESKPLPDLSFGVSETTTPGVYVYTFAVYDENGSMLKSDAINFRIEGTEKTFKPIEVLVCGDRRCNDVRKIFTPNDEVYIKVNSEETPEIRGYVVYPNKSVEMLKIDESTGHVKIGRPGLYEIGLVFSKEGYADREKVVRFSVIGGESKIHYEFCNESRDYVCDDECPYGKDPDCEEPVGNVDTTWMVFVLVAVSVVVFIFVFLKRSQNINKALRV